MSSLRGSANYVWCITNVLGKGATGAVFQGVNKNHGEPVAVKTFNQQSHMRPHDVQVREFEVLSMVNHKNIVKLLAIEDEQESRGKVIVMELCTGGSLFDILNDPENTYGLPEEEFLLVVEHLSAGMKHLRDNNLVHRDLKPGNIMKFINDDGTSIYKLTDFGAARELKEDQEFMSLYGTEEYLHPDMYKKAVLNRPVGKMFDATVDLWSIGVTLYHVATGNLPFRPFGGRKNKETMYNITTRKAAGVISGVQTSKNGQIEWGKTLPAHCQLSAGLKKVITPLLAGLLEVDPNKIWNFERYFTEVQERLSNVPIHIFFVNKVSLIKVFLQKNDCLKVLQNQIQEQTEVPPQNQIILYKDQLLTSVVDEMTPGTAYPPTTEKDPLMLFYENNTTGASSVSISLSPEREIPKFPIFPNVVSVENDANQAKEACSVGHDIKRRIETLSHNCYLTDEYVHRWVGALRRSLKELSARASSLTMLAAQLADTADVLDIGAHSTQQIKWIISRNSEETAPIPNNGQWAQEMRVLNDEMSSTWNSIVSQLHTQHVIDDTLLKEWKHMSSEIKCPHANRLPQRAKTLVNKLRDSLEHLIRDRNWVRERRSLPSDDEHFHKMEKVRVTEAGYSAKRLLDKECTLNAVAMTEALDDWYKVAQTVYVQSKILDKDLTAADLKLRAFSAKMKDGIVTMKDQLDKAVQQIPNMKKDITRTEREETYSDNEKKNVVNQENPDKLYEDTLAMNNELKQMCTLQNDIIPLLKKIQISFHKCQ